MAEGISFEVDGPRLIIRDMAAFAEAVIALAEALNRVVEHLQIEEK